MAWLRRGEERRGDFSASVLLMMSSSLPPRHQSEAKGQVFHSDLIVSHTGAKKRTQEGKREGRGRSCFNIDTDDWRPHLTMSVCDGWASTYRKRNGKTVSMQRHTHTHTQALTETIEVYLPSGNEISSIHTASWRGRHRRPQEHTLTYQVTPHPRYRSLTPSSHCQTLAWMSASTDHICFHPFQRVPYNPSRSTMQERP